MRKTVRPSASKEIIFQREGEARFGLQPADERLSHRGGRGPEPSAHRIMRDVARQTDGALGDHLGRRTVAGVLVALETITDTFQAAYEWTGFYNLVDLKPISGGPTA